MIVSQNSISYSSRKKFVDVMLVAAEGRTLKAHRLILSASSQYLEVNIRGTPCVLQFSF